jgi:uncharacterized protein YraI
MKTSKILAAGAAALVLSAGAAFAQSGVTATTDLNVRGGPGPQYPVIGVLGAGQGTILTGCIENSKWCSIDDGGQRGWVYSDYLTGEFGGQRMVLTERPADSGVVVVERPDGAAEGALVGGATGAIGGALIGGPIGAAVGGVAGMAVGGAAGDVAEPPAEVRTYVTSHRVEPVYLEGEVVVGATVPETVAIHEIPRYEYRYINVNGQEVLVEPGTRRIVYVLR